MSKRYVMLDAGSLPESDFHQERRLLEENGYECILANCRTAEEIIACAKDADMIGDVYLRIDRNIISQLERCTAIIRYGIGYDVVDVAAASEKGIAVYNLPTYCVEDVATHAFALMLSMIRKTAIYDRALREGNWQPDLGYRMHRLGSLTLGLLGFGNTARILAGYAKGTGMHVAASDPFLSDEVFSRSGIERMDCEKLYETADIISIHIPLTQQTRHLINRETIGRMRDGVMIINTSRGGIIDLEALADAMETGQVRAVGLDVFEEEPLPADSRILTLENAVLTPHVAYMSEESSDEQHMQAAETVLAVFKGQQPANIVNVVK